MKFLAKALGNALGGGIAGELLIEVLPAVASDVWKWWTQERNEQQRRAEIEAIAQEGIQEVRKQIAEVVQTVLGDQSVEVQQQVEIYLGQLPAAIRRSLRRPADPSGTTVPAGLMPRKGDDLLKFLPPRVSRFRLCAQPLAEDGMPEAQWLYADCLLEGVGVSKEPVAAARWFRKAAEQGFALAQMSLGNRYYRGEGVRKDIVQAIHWYSKAADQGQAAAKSMLRAICEANQ